MSKTLGCEAFHVELDGLTDNIRNDFYRAIKEVTGSQNKADVIAGLINQEKFIQWLNEDSGFIDKNNPVKDVFRYNPRKTGYTDKNQFKKWIRAYNRVVNPGVSTFTKKKDIDSIGYFNSTSVRQTALSFTGDLILNAYYSQASNNTDININSKKVAEDIRDKVKNKIINDFLINVNTYIESEDIASDKRVAKFIEAANNISKYKTEINTLSKQIRDIILKSKELDKNARIIKDEDRQKYLADKKELSNQFKILSTNLNQAKAEYNNAKALAVSEGRKIISNDTNQIKLYNYGCLAFTLIADDNQWFSYVLRQPKLLDFSKAFSKAVEGKNIQEPSNEEADFENPENALDDEQSVDESTKTWTDKIYGNYLKYFNGRLKTYLSSIYKLSSVNKVRSEDNGAVKEDYDYDTSNELGVRQTIGANYIIANIITFADYTSVDSFINSIERIANNIPSLSGLIKMVDDMRADEKFANFIITTFDKFVVPKATLNIDGGELNLNQSNKRAFVGYNLFTHFSNLSKITCSNEFDLDDEAKLQAYKNQIRTFGNKEGSEVFNDVIKEMLPFLTNYVKKYFPGFDSENVKNYLYSDPNKNIINTNNLLTALINFNNAAGKLKDDIDAENVRVRLENRKIRDNQMAAMYEGRIYSGPSYQSFDIRNINFSSFESKVAPLAKIFATVNDSDCEFNSRTSENNNSSDLIEPSYLTRFIEILNTAIDENGNIDEYRGLKILYNFFGKKGVDKLTGFHDYSTILYGIKDPNNPNKYLKEGLFIKNGDTVKINPNAKNLINLTLFNGVRNNDLSEGTPYEKMSSSDYFITTINAYFSPIAFDPSVNKDTLKDTMANIFMRIPSDASNQYIIQVPKFKYEGLYNYDNTATIYFDNILNPYRDKLDLKVSYGTENTDTSKITKQIAKSPTDYLKNYKNNIVSRNNANFIIDLIRNNGIKNLHLAGYKQIYLKKADEIIIPIIYNTEDSKFVIYLKGTSEHYRFSGEIVSIQSLNKIKTEDEFGLITETLTPVQEQLDNFVLENINEINLAGYNDGQIQRRYNKNNAIFQGFKQNVKGEFNKAIIALTDLFKYKDGEFILRDDKDGLAQFYHYKGNLVDENGRLTGAVFNFNKLFDINDFSARKLLLNTFFYGGGQDNLVIKDGSQYKLNLNKTNPIFTVENGQLRPNLIYDSQLDYIIEQWLDNYIKFIGQETNRYADIIGETYTQEQVNEAILNQTLNYMEFDDLFEGDSKFYKNAQTFLKRDKEVQAGGSAYSGAVNNAKFIGGHLYNLTNQNGEEKKINLIYQGKQVDSGLVARNGWQAVTINNTETVYDNAKAIYDNMHEKLEKEVSKAFADKVAANIASAFGYNNGAKTTANDAQSYITLKEWIRRKWADGTLDEYGELPYKLLNNIELTKEDYNNIKKIQVQKNFYYDQYFDPITGIYYPRQIKNAEFVLIPQFLDKDSSLYKLAEIMDKHDIGQVNTKETSKAGNTDILDFWSKTNELDENGNLKYNDKGFEQDITYGKGVQNYYYQYLFKQQDVVDHIMDEENKAGIQIMKKIQDNIVDTKAIVEAQLKEEIAGIKQDAINDGTFMKAPNGKPTNLNEKQWLQVRTKAFKNWFGDWENNPSEASKVVDENGEPLVVYHGSSQTFDTFDTTSIYTTNNKYMAKSYIFENDGWGINEESLSEAKSIAEEELYNKYRKLGYDEEEALKKAKEENQYKYKVYSLFINLRNPKIINAEYKNWDRIVAPEYLSEEAIKEAEEVGLNIDDIATFSTRAIEEIELKKKEHDGIIIKNVFDNGTIKENEAGHNFIAFNSNQIKSATDNSGLFSKTDNNIYDTVTNKTAEAINTIQNLFVENIKESYETLIKDCGWKESNGILVNEDGTPIKFNAFYRRFREEAQRLGMNSNFYDYITPDENGNVKMPNWMNIASSKLESIAQSIFNNAVLRQTLPGFHAVQVSNIGFSRKLQYRKKITNKNDEEVTVCECIVAPWNTEIKDLINRLGKEKALEYLRSQDLDLFVGYRIPTEGKQSTVVFQVVDFLDEAQGSTMVVPYEWVTQTGSDFDVDTIYTITKELFINQKEDSDNFGLPEEKTKDRAGRNNKILDNFIKILSDPSVQEEILLRSNFDILTEAKNKYDKYVNKDSAQSVYNPFTQYRFMQNAIDGRKLKAFSVNRDTFNSINNLAHTTLDNTIAIRVRYDLNEYNEDNLKKAFTDYKDGVVTHNTIGWTNNNRNADGFLLTAYSSQTTAHILDAIKEGALFNETDYTFASFKTLIDAGIDYETAISFLYQPAITLVNNKYFAKNSNFIDSNANPINEAIKQLAIDYGLTFKNNASNKDIIKFIQKDENLQNKFYNYWGISIKNASDIILDKHMFERRLENKITDKDEQFVHDFGVLMFFSKLHKTSKAIEDIMQVCKPDSFGAKQTIHSTKKIVENAKKLAINDLSYSKGGLLKVENKTLVEALYPGILQDNISVKDSVYPYIAAFMKYATITSTNINSQLFFTESDGFDKFTNKIIQRIGKDLTDDQYAELKRYIITCFYNTNSQVINPKTITSTGHIKDDLDFMKDNVTDYLKKEYLRVTGLRETVPDNIVIEDINNPTDEELENFKRLTPLQKVLYIQKRFSDDCGIFNYITYSKFYQGEIEEKGYSTNKLRINIENRDIENLYNEFRQTFFIDNKLFKLAAVDLVKYAVMVEGLNFRKGNISKVIPNDVLLAETSDFGIFNVQDLSKNLIEVLNNNSEEISDKFVRSHSEYIKLIKLRNGKKQTDTKLGELFESCSYKYENVDTGMKTIYCNDTYKELINSLFLNTIATGEDLYANVDLTKYIRVSIDNKKPVLYKVFPNIGTDERGYLYISSFDLVPLNLLNSEETQSISLNNNNNQFYNYDFYKAIRNQDDVKIDDYVIPKYKREISVIEDNEDHLTRLAEGYNTTPIVQAQAQAVIDKIIKWYKSGSANEVGVFQLRGQLANTILGLKNNSTLQTINIDDKLVTVRINGKYKTSQLVGYHKQQIGAEDAPKRTIQLTPYLKSVYEEKDDKYKLHFNANNTIDGIYSIKLINILDPTVELTEDIEDIERSGNELASAIDPIKYPVGNTSFTTKFDSVDEIANLIANELNSEATYRNNKNAKRAISLLSRKGVTVNTKEAIKKYERNIYEVGAEYYSDLAHQLLNRMKNFEIGGHIYDITDGELYDELAENPEKASQLYNLLIKAKLFGAPIYQIFEISAFDTEDIATKNAIESIQNSINSVRNNTAIQTAIDLLYNRFLAKTYSNNPLIERGYVNLTDVFGDTDWFDTNIADVCHINHKQLQVVVKLALDAKKKAQLDAQDTLADFNKWWNNIEKEMGSDKLKESLDKIIDKQGKFVRPYTDDFIKDKEALQDKLRNTLRLYGKYSKEYQETLLERDKWLLENTERPVKDAYYRKSIAIRESVLKNAGDLYLQYLELNDHLRNDFGKFDELSPEQKDDKRKTNAALESLNSQYNTDGTKKSPEELAKLTALNTYRKDIANLNAKYFDYVEPEDFADRYDKNKKILDKYEEKYSESTPLELRDKFAEYRDAYDWIKYNVSYNFSDEGWKQIKEAFAAFKTKEDADKPAITRIINKYDKAERYDANGTLIGTIYSLEEARIIRDIMNKKYTPYEVNENGELINSPYNENHDSIESDNALLKDIPKNNLPILTDEFYRKYFLDDDEKSRDTRIAKWKLYAKINPLLQRGFDENGHLNAKLLDSRLSDEELENLANYFDELRAISTGSNRNIEESTKEDKPYKYVINSAAARANESLINKAKGSRIVYLEKIFFDFDNKQNIRKDKKGKYIGNRFIYGYIQLNQKVDEFGNKVYTDEARKYIDAKKTKARRFLNDNIEYTLTEYYYKAKRDAQEKGEDAYNEWYEANHVYNPYNHEWEPIRIWTSMKPKAGSSLAEQYTHNATFENREKVIKDDAINENYIENGDNFKPRYRNGDVITTSKYLNSEYSNLTDKEVAIINRLREIMSDYAITYKQQRFVKEGFAPRVYKEKADAKYYTEQVLNALGFGGIMNGGDGDWHDFISYDKDFDAKFSLYDILKTSGFEQVKPLPRRLEFATEQEFVDEYNKVKAENQEIRKRNLERDNEYLDRDWKKVFGSVILQGSEYKARASMKDLLYLTLDDIRTRDAYYVNGARGILGSISLNRKQSLDDYNAYLKSNQRNTADVFANWIRRYLFEEYRKPNALGKVARGIQSFTTAKFMALNLFSGINNVNVGGMNILQEMFAGDYINGKYLKSAFKEYTSHIFNYINDAFTEGASTETSAIFKMLNIVELDQKLYAPETRRELNMSDAAQTANELLYSFMTSGEHMMQNTMLLALLESNRVYTDYKGKTVIGSIQDYTSNIEELAFSNILNSKKWIKYATAFNQYTEDIKNNKDKAYKYETLQKDIVSDFIRSDFVASFDKKELAQDYINERKQLKDKYLKDFEKLPTVRSQIHFDKETGREVLNDNALITNAEVASFANKATFINKKIHGVYDKLGAAKIEHHWWGALVMQYRKHLYPGIMKHWRRKGYFNEIRGTQDYGSIQGIFDLLSADIGTKEGFNKGFELTEVSNEKTLANACLSILNTAKGIINSLLDIGFNYQLLPEYKQNAIKRNLGPLCGILSSILMVMILYALWDDDDIKESNTLASIIQLSDRLYQECVMYDFVPGGAISEIKTDWQRPAVGISTLEDLAKATDLIWNWMVDPEFNPNYTRGVYKGQNKLGVIIRKNIPLYRQFMRFDNMAKNNHYYRLNDSNWNTHVGKNIGITIHESIDGK